MPPATAPAGRTAVVAHGAGSTADFARRALGPALEAAGWHLEAVEDRTGDVEAVAAAVAAAVRRSDAGLVGGISLGAHAVARWAAREGPAGLSGLLLVLPAWTGPTAEVAAASTAAARRVEQRGVDGALADLADGSWVAAELARAWPAYGSGLAAALDAAGRSAGPTADEMAALDVPVGIVGLRDDPFHPVEVARAWAGGIPGAGYVELGPEQPAADVSILGAAAVAALARSAGPSHRGGVSGSR